MPSKKWSLKFSTFLLNTMKMIPPRNNDEMPCSVGQNLSAEVELALTPGYKHNARFIKGSLTNKIKWKPFTNRFLEDISVENYSFCGVI